MKETGLTIKEKQILSNCLHQTIARQISFDLNVQGFLKTTATKWG